MLQAQTPGIKHTKPHGRPSGGRDEAELLLLLQVQQLLLLLKSGQHCYMQVCTNCAAQREVM